MMELLRSYDCVATGTTLEVYGDLGFAVMQHVYIAEGDQPKHIIQYVEGQETKVIRTTQDVTTILLEAESFEKHFVSMGGVVKTEDSK